MITYIIIIVLLAAAAAWLLAVRAQQQREIERLSREKEEVEASRRNLETEYRNLDTRHQESARTLAALQAEYQAKTEALNERLRTQLETERQHREEEQQRKEQERETLRLQFRELADEILGEQSRHFKESNRESMDTLLKPFRENITDFRRRVEEIYTTQNTQRGELKNELERLMELNRNISAEAQNLTNALKGNSKIQGDWGEMLLETILDNSSLTKGIHYQTQLNIKDAEGNNLRPDVVVNLPDNKHLVIDSKVSLTAFTEYMSAENRVEQKRFLDQHVASVRQHVNELGRKEYQKLLKSPDFVIMFIPNEPAFLEATKADHSIWSDAYAKKVLISSPTNLYAILKIVAELWKYNDQDKNTKEIAACGLKLYEQAVAMSSSLANVGTFLDKAKGAYDDAYKRLHTGNDNIVRVGERLKRTANLQSQKEFSASLREKAENEIGE